MAFLNQYPQISILLQIILLRAILLLLGYPRQIAVESVCKEGAR